VSLWWVAVLLLGGLTVSTLVGLLDALHEMRERTRERTRPRRRDQTLEEAVDAYKRRR